MSNDAERQVWLRTNEIEEFIDSLAHTAKLAGQVKDDVKVWKWLIIALHSALQGACVCALRGHDTAGVMILTRKSRNEVWHWLDVESRNYQVCRVSSLTPLMPSNILPQRTRHFGTI